MRARESWDELALCTQWQAKGFCEAFGIEPGRVTLLGNGVSPAFEALLADPCNLSRRKPWPSVLCYTSTPFRGLDVLVDAFPRICERVPGAVLKVFSSMAVYGFFSAQDEHVALYERCRRTEGVEYIGSVSQSNLARELAGATCLAYANTFAENYSIAVLEALAAGLIVIASDLGGLRETTFGFALLLPLPAQRQQFVEQYAEFAAGILLRY